MDAKRKVILRSLLPAALGCAALAGCAETPGDEGEGVRWRLRPVEQESICVLETVRDGYCHRSQLRQELRELWCRVKALPEEEEPAGEQVGRREDEDTSAMVKRAVLGAGTYPVYVRELTARVEGKASDLAIDCAVLRHRMRELHLLLCLEGDTEDREGPKPRATRPMLRTTVP
jgi:hypothetical protein